MTIPLPAPMQAAPLISDWIRFGPGHSVLVLSGRVELGQGNLTAILQIAADELDIPPAMVAITGADTTRTPSEGFTAGSMSIMQCGLPRLPRVTCYWQRPQGCCSARPTC